jgi:hypothetical protein
MFAAAGRKNSSRGRQSLGDPIFSPPAARTALFPGLLYFLGAFEKAFDHQVRELIS